MDSGEELDDPGSESFLLTLLFCSSMTSISPTSLVPSLNKTRLRWARRQFCFNSSRIASIALHIFKAGPNLIAMADIK